MYTISEFSKKIGISEYTLRYYEKEGLIEPSRDQHNYRMLIKILSGQAL